MKGGLVTDRNKKIILIILAALLTASITTLAILKFSDSEPPDKAFTPPAFDETAESGTPEVTGEYYKSNELAISEGKCVVSMDLNPIIEEDKLQVFLTSSDVNTTWIRIVLYNQDQRVGESGLIRPGEYVRYVTLTEKVESGCSLKAKLLTYEPDTYYSLGTATADIIVR